MSTKRPGSFPDASRGPAKRFKPGKARAQLSVRTPAVASGPKQVGAGSAAIAKDVRPLPGGLDVEAFIKARSHEVSTLQEAMRMAASRLTTRAFQSLPRHLRRRAASHNPRRVPTRLRDKARMEIDVKDKTVKMQQKKARIKRKVTVADVYRYRQTDKTWLETHIWHAKRMHMIDTWGYRLARTPTRKSRRPAFRAARHACVIQDISYFATVEVSGLRGDIIAMLKRCLGISPWAGSKYESGARRAHTTLHHDAAWPKGLIGPVEVLWCPFEAERDRKLWLRMHPAMFSEAWATIRTSLLQLAKTAREVGLEVESDERPGSSLKVRDLRGAVGSFEIMGPQAGSVIHSIGKLCGGQDESRVELWRSLAHQQSSATIPQDWVLGVDIQDPRLSFPPRRCRVDLDLTSKWEQPTRLDMATSRLWDAKCREQLVKPRFTKAELDVRRHQSGEPGKRLKSGAKDDRIPIILVQTTHRGSSSDNGVHGYTLLLPAGWSMPLWQSLVFTGALVGGIDERRIQQAEMAKPSFPDCFPATKAGDTWWYEKAETDVRRWRKRPPAKRLSTIGLGVQQGWKPDWQVCIPEPPRDEDTAAGAVPAPSQPWLLPSGLTHLPLMETGSLANTVSHISNLRQRMGRSASVGSGFATHDVAECIIQISIECRGRGQPAPNAAIFHGEVVDEAKGLAEVLPNSRPIGFVLYGGTSMQRGHGWGIAAVSYASYIAEESRQGTSRKEGIQVVFRNRGEPCAWSATARIAM